MFINHIRNYKGSKNIHALRRMSVHQLAEFIDSGADFYCPHTVDGSVFCDKESCVYCIEKWLNEESK